MLASLQWSDRLWGTWLHARVPDLLSRLILQWIQTVMALLGNSEKSKKKAGWKKQGTVFGELYILQAHSGLPILLVCHGTSSLCHMLSWPWCSFCFITGMEATEPAMTSRLKPILWKEIKLSSNLVFWVVHPSNTKSNIDKQIGRTKP